VGNLTNVALSEGLLSIGPNAFYGGSKLAYVTIPSSVTNIGNGAFSSAAFTNIFVPANVSYIGVNAFGGPTLTNISVDPGSANSLVVIEACMALQNPVWSALATNSLTAGNYYFSESGWTNFPARFYRVRSL
jgi:hypothetical protein